jgi:hypothetical protein
MVSLENLERFRLANFSIAVNAPTATVESIRSEIGGYAAARSREVSAHLRRAADDTHLLDRLEEIYKSVIVQHASARRQRAAATRAATLYLRRLTPLVSMLESQVIGHRRSAVTGTAARKVLFEHCHALQRRFGVPVGARP